MTDFKRILYLEKDFSLLRLVKDVIESKGFIVEGAEDNIKCKAQLASTHFDILLVDFFSINASLDFLKRFSEEESTMPIIMVLEISEIHQIPKIIKMGCADYVLKDKDHYIELLLLGITKALEKIQLIKDKNTVEKKLSWIMKASDRVQAIAKVGNWEYYPGEKFAKWSKQEFRNFGYQPDSVAPTYEKYIETIHPADRGLVEHLNVSCIDNHEPTEFVFRLLLKNEKIRYIHAITEVDVDSNDELVRVFGVSQDITEQKMTEAGLKQAATVYEKTTEAIFVCDQQNQIVSVNPAFTVITGYSEQDIIGKTPTHLASGFHDEHFFQEFWENLNQKGFLQGEIWNRHKDGHIFPVWQSITAIKDGEGHIVQYVSIFSDISKRKKEEDQIRYQANYDALTDLPNRTLYNDRIKSTLLHAKRTGKHVALMLLDLDRFKWINDNLGHRVGDLVLQETGKRLKQAVRGSDTVARIGGDEFTIILPELEQAVDAEIIATKIFSSFAKPLDIDGNEVNIAGSIGISIFPENGEDAITLLKNADNAMYSAKQAGHNRFHFFTASMRAEAEHRLEIISYLHSAMEKNEFFLVYQPIIDLKTNKICSAEALIRWQHPDLGFITPAEFIPLAEEAGLIKSIGDWVVLNAAQDMQRWKQMDLWPITISINKSPAQFSKQAIDGTWYETFKAHGIPLSDITLEITETVFMEKGRNYIDELSNMKSLGIQISLDDFGTGYSSLSYLKRFPVDILKIDGAFISGITTDSSDALLVEAIITLAEKMKIKVIAEGVETEEQLAMLKQYNCRYAQGYYFSKPLTVNKFELYLKNL